MEFPVFRNPGFSRFFENFDTQKRKLPSKMRTFIDYFSENSAFLFFDIWITMFNSRLFMFDRFV